MTPDKTFEHCRLAGENLRAGPNTPDRADRDAWRKQYLQWVDHLHGAIVDQAPERLPAFETTRWQMVVENRISDDELVRTILGDVDVQLTLLDEVIADQATQANDVKLEVPARWPADPGTVGMAVFDANCLFPKHVRHLLLGFSVRGIVLGRWTRELLAEAAGSLAKTLRGDSLEDLGRWLKQEADIVRDSLVEGHLRWIDVVSLPDTDDAHVLAAAIECGATTIVTDNVKDFPNEVLAPYGIWTQTADAFAHSCVNANPVLAARTITDHSDPERFLIALATPLPTTAALLSKLLD